MMKSLFYVLLILILSHTLLSHCCLQEERVTLIQIKSYINSVNNRRHADEILPSWVLSRHGHGDGEDCCMWEEVRCDPSTRHVTRLYLNFTVSFDEQPWPLNLTIFQPLQELISLSLPWNSIGSLIGGFQVLSKLKKLQVLDLATNKIRGMVTPHGLCESRSLQQLHLDSNRFSGNLPPCLANMTFLQVIDLSHNKLTGSISSILSNLTSLVHLNVNDNNFEPISIRHSFLNTPNLQQLGLSNNDLLMQDVEDFLWTPPFQLRYLQLNNCNLKKLPVHFLFNQHDLYHIEMIENHFTGTFPTWLLQNNSQLEGLYLSMNSLIGSLEFPDHHNLSLAYLDVSGNQLSGIIQTNIGAILPNLVSLYASQNHFHGQIPASIGNLTMLEDFDLSQNYFFGELPQSLFTNCISLSSIKLSSNQFHGQIIPDIVNLTQLNWLFLDDNHFNRFPDDPYFPSQLSVLDVSNNNLVGEFPRWIGEVTEMQILSMAGNTLQGTIPKELCQLTSLTFLDLSKNALEGVIPSCLSSISKLSYLHLHNNRFSGHIPYTLANTSKLIILDLSYNRLLGGIPIWVDQLQNLQVLLLGGNSLTGDLPIQLCHLQHLNIMDLSNNRIFGHIHSCFNNLSLGTTNGTSDGYSQEQLGFKTKDRNYFYVGSSFMNMSGLDLSCNQLTGHIPSELGDLKGMHALNLSHNRLSGPIPRSFLKLKSIESLDLSYNILTGPIPSELVSLNFLEIFNASYNNLSGKPPDNGQFATFDVDNYRGNPLLCGYPQGRRCDHGSKEDNQQRNEVQRKFDWVIFLWSFGMSFPIFFLAFVGTIYINHQWRKALFLFFDMYILCRQG